MRRGRQIEGDGRPDPDLGGDRDIAIVLGDNGMGNGEAESIATGFGGNIGIKDVWQLVCRYATALITNSDLDPASWGKRRRERGLTGEIVRPHLNDPALGHCLLGIEDHM